MPILEMKVPSPGESISEVEIATWLVADGDYVFKDQAIAEVDSDKATLELPAEAAGTITLKAEEGDAVAVGAVVCLIDTDAEAPADAAPPAAAPVAAPAPCARSIAAPRPLLPRQHRPPLDMRQVILLLRRESSWRSRVESRSGGRFWPRWPRLEARRSERFGGRRAPAQLARRRLVRQP